MPDFAAILLTAVGLGGTVVMLVFLLASMPNSSKKQLKFLRRVGYGIAAFGLAALAGAIAAQYSGRPLLAGIIGVLPAVMLVVVVAWGLIRKP